LDLSLAALPDPLTMPLSIATVMDGPVIRTLALLLRSLP